MLANKRLQVTAARRAARCARSIERVCRAHIGTALLQRVQDWARRQDFELLLVAPSDTAESFYHRAGFHDATSFRQCRFRPFDDEELPTDGSHPRAI